MEKEIQDNLNEGIEMEDPMVLMQKEIEYLREQNKELRNQNKELMELAKRGYNLEAELKAKNDIIAEMKSLLAVERNKSTEALQAVNALTNTNNEVLKLVQSNIKTLCVSQRMKSSSGENNPTFKTGLKTEDLARDYIKSNYKLTSDIVQKYDKQFGITYNGLRLRLKRAGIWKVNIK